MASPSTIDARVPAAPPQQGSSRGVHAGHAFSGEPQHPQRGRNRLRGGQPQRAHLLQHRAEPPCDALARGRGRRGAAELSGCHDTLSANCSWGPADPPGDAGGCAATAWHMAKSSANSRADAAACAWHRAKPSADHFADDAAGAWQGSESAAVRRADNAAGAWHGAESAADRRADDATSAAAQRCRSRVAGRASPALALLARPGVGHRRGSNPRRGRRGRGCLRFAAASGATSSSVPSPPGA